MRLASNLNLSAAVPLCAEIVQARGAAIKIDASSVECLGGLCLQVLIAAAAAWRRDGFDLVITKPSPAFSEALRLMGAQELLYISEAA